jgi:signal peptidase II
MSTRKKIILFCLCCVAFIGCDRITKSLAKVHLKGKEPLTYFHDTMRLLYTENTGAALSLGDGLPKTASFWLLSIVPLLILLALFIYTIKHLQQMRTMKLVSLALIFSGGIGNIIDRVFFDRHVTDFINMGIGNLRTGIFNVADVCITAGVIGLLFFFNDKKSIAVPAENEPLS